MHHEANRRPLEIQQGLGDAIYALDAYSSLTEQVAPNPYSQAIA